MEVGVGAENKLYKWLWMVKKVLFTSPGSTSLSFLKTINYLLSFICEFRKDVNHCMFGSVCGKIL